MHNGQGDLKKVAGIRGRTRDADGRGSGSGSWNVTCGERSPSSSTIVAPGPLRRPDGGAVARSEVPSSAALESASVSDSELLAAPRFFFRLDFDLDLLFFAFREGAFEGSENRRQNVTSRTLN